MSSGPKSLNFNEVAFLTFQLIHSGLDFVTVLRRIDAVCPTPELRGVLADLDKCDERNCNALGDVFIRAALASEDSSYKAFFSQLAVSATTGVSSAQILNYLADTTREKVRPDSESQEIIQALTPLFEYCGMDLQELRNYLRGE